MIYSPSPIFSPPSQRKTISCHSHGGRLDEVTERRAFRSGRLAGGVEPNFLHPRLGQAQQLLAATLERLAALVDRDRLLERHLALFQPFDDGFELLDRPFEGQARDIGMDIVGHDRVPVSGAPI